MYDANRHVSCCIFLHSFLSFFLFQFFHDCSVLFICPTPSLFPPASTEATHTQLFLGFFFLTHEDLTNYYENYAMLKLASAQMDEMYRKGLWRLEDCSDS